MNGALIAVSVLFVLLVAWFYLDVLRGYDTTSDTALRELSVRRYLSGRAWRQSAGFAGEMRNAGSGDHFRDGAVLSRALFADDVSKGEWETVHAGVLR